MLKMRFEIEPNCWTERMPSGETLGPSIVERLPQAAALLQACHLTYPSLQFNDQIRRHMDKTIIVACRPSGEDRASTCGEAGRETDDTLITLFPAAYGNDRRGCHKTKVGETIIHEFLHLAGVPSELMHNFMGGQTENDAVFGIERLCAGGDESLGRLFYSQCMSALGSESSADEICAGIKYERLYDLMRNSKAYAANKQRRCPIRRRCRPEDIVWIMEETFENVVYHQSDISLDEEELAFLRQRYIGPPPHFIEDLPPEYYINK